MRKLKNVNWKLPSIPVTLRQEVITYKLKKNFPKNTTILGYETIPVAYCLLKLLATDFRMST
jgi:hypothetical protein